MSSQVALNSSGVQIKTKIAFGKDEDLEFIFLRLMNQIMRGKSKLKKKYLFYFFFYIFRI